MLPTCVALELGWNCAFVVYVLPTDSLVPCRWVGIMVQNRGSRSSRRGSQLPRFAVITAHPERIFI